MIEIHFVDHKSHYKRIGGFIVAVDFGKKILRDYQSKIGESFDLEYKINNVIGNIVYLEKL